MDTELTSKLIFKTVKGIKIWPAITLAVAPHMKLENEEDEETLRLNNVKKKKYIPVPGTFRRIVGATNIILEIKYNNILIPLQKTSKPSDL